MLAAILILHCGDVYLHLCPVTMHTCLGWGKANGRKKGTTIRDFSQLLRSLFCLFCPMLAAILILRCGDVHPHLGLVRTH